jgi:hypothetical protein
MFYKIILINNIKQIRQLYNIFIKKQIPLNYFHS